jgi:hypothetical protein
MTWVGLQTSENGGSEILGYDLWRDDGDEGDFVGLLFTDTIMALSFTDRTPITSLVYRYKYRARNINGWGEFSEVGYLYAADVPKKS